MMLPPGGFFMIGLLLRAAPWRDLRKMTRAQVEQAVADDAARAAADAKEREAIGV